MSQNVEAFSQQFDISRSLGVVALTGLEALLSLQFDQAQALASRNSEQLRSALSESSGMSDPAQLPELMQRWTTGANILIHDSLISGIDYQMEIFRLLQLQAAETRDVIAESLHQQVVPVDQSSGRNRHATKTLAYQQMKAA
jgi:hypothetical protein